MEKNCDHKTCNMENAYVDACHYSRSNRYKVTDATKTRGMKATRIACRFPLSTTVSAPGILSTPALLTLMESESSFGKSAVSPLLSKLLSFLGEL